MKNYRFSGIHDAKKCLCASSLVIHSANETCLTECPADITKSCGGPTSVSVYETGFLGKLILFKFQLQMVILLCSILKYLGHRNHYHY